MGVSTDALLFWGIAFPDEYDREEERDDDEPNPLRSDWETVYCEARGLKRPHVDWIEDGKHGWDPATPEQRQALDAYREARRQLIDACPCEITFHCSSESPMLVVALKRTLQKARRGYPVEPELSIISVDERAAFEEFMDLLKIPSDGHWPRWWLASYWG
ncbi:MAG: hypothetical protein OES13_00295 [Acidimicrobiia bacterium]|nr:hypothetical protein [Acidimicrobiia bacterium]